MGAIRKLLGSLRGGRLAVAIVLASIVLLVLARALGIAYVEILWHGETGHGATFWRRVSWAWGTRTLAGAAVAVLVFINLRIASLTLGGIHIRRRFGNIEISEQLPQAYVSSGIWAVAVLLGLWFGAAVPANLGIQLLTLVHADPWGVVEPVLGRDAGFYVFVLPVLASVVTFALVVTFLVFTLATAGYATTGAVRWVRGRLDVQDLARVHLGALVAIFFLLIAVRTWLGRPLLLLDGNSAVQEIFGFADAEARLPALQTLAIISVAAAAGVFWGARRNRLAPAAFSLGAVIVGAIVIGQIYPGLIQSFRVEPNELARETPYIEHNLRFTRMGFGLGGMERHRFAYESRGDIDWAEAAEHLDGLPIWNRSSLLQTFRAVEARFPYYDFADITMDRYAGPEGPEIVALSVRQIDPEGIQDPNWQNRHLRDLYVRGMGVVASLATTRSRESRPAMLITGIPPEPTEQARSIPELSLERSDIYFGSRPQLYALVNPAAAPTEQRPSGGTALAEAPQGIELGSRLRTALLAWRFGDANLLFASDLGAGMRLVHRREVRERAQAIAPFLRFPEAPYAVVADGRVVWVLEGFTGTRAFPLSSVHEFGVFRSQLSYVRNSVKVTVDAVTGAVDFYRVPAPDPLADAYERAFPGLLRPIAEMPESVRRHVRYPRALLDLQARVLLQYHQNTAADFHGQQDVWIQAQQHAEGAAPGPYFPEYGLYRFPGDVEPRFNLTTVFVPAGRQNLTGLLAGRTDAHGVPELDLLDVPVADQVPGPRQIEALAEQDPIISQQFSLWRTGGSEVWTGHLHLLPIGGRMLYVEPVFLAAEAESIPELRRFLVSDGLRVVMAEQLADAMTLLGGAGEHIAGQGSPPGADGTTEGAPVWPAEALRLLERAEERARSGDWEAYGAALTELRTLLERLSGP